VLKATSVDLRVLSVELLVLKATSVDLRVLSVELLVLKTTSVDLRIRSVELLVLKVDLCFPLLLHVTHCIQSYFNGSKAEC
jgi:hypothetical protein